MSVQIKGVGTIGGIDQGLNTVGVITATSFVGSGANLTNLPAANLTGTLPAISGANLTSLPSQVTINNASGNRVITSDGGTTLNGEDTLRYDGTNFLIGTNTEAPYSNRNLTVAAGGSGSSTVAIEIRSPSNGSGRVIFSDGTSADSSANEGQVIYQQSDHKMLFGVAANYQNMALESTGGTGADLNLIDGNLKFASGHGIDFSSASGSASGSSSALLDDYEEGSWTPTYVGGGGSLTVNGSYSVQAGKYIKIGNMVFVEGGLRANVTNNSNGTFDIAGLPFTVVDNSNSTGILHCKDQASWTVAPHHFSIMNNTTKARARGGIDVGDSQYTNGNTTMFASGSTNNNRVYFSGSYRTA